MWRRSRVRSGQVDVALALAGEAQQRPLQRVAERAADEQRVGERRERIAVLELVLQLERHLDAVWPRLEGDALRPAQLLVLDPERLARARFVDGDALHDPAAAAGA